MLLHMLPGAVAFSPVLRVASDDGDEVDCNKSKDTFTSTPWSWLCSAGGGINSAGLTSSSSFTATLFSVTEES